MTGAPPDLEQDLPRVISVDDHVLEPPELWTSRLSGRHRDRAPRVVRERGVLDVKTGGWSVDPAGAWADVWYYETVVKPLDRRFAAVGSDLKTLDAATVVTYDDIRSACWKQSDRLADMDADHVDVSLCFPNTLPRFCGQTFAEEADKELGLLCVEAYNDWMIDEWAAGAGHGRLIPLTILPLWDAGLAAAEMERCAAKGSFAVTFPEDPHFLGLPSIYTGHWDRFFAACAATQTTICMHIGSSSRSPTTSPDAPHMVSSTLTFQNGMGSLIDFVLSGTLARFPGMKIAYSEANVGWMPYVLERMDRLWERRGSHTDYGSDLPAAPSSYIAGRVYGCIIDDVTGLANRERIGMDQICFETDYPHADATFPNTLTTIREICGEAGLDDDESYRLLRGNAITAFGLERFGITS